MPANKSRNQHLNLLSTFHDEAFSHFLLTYLSTSILRGHCPGSLWKAICTLGLNDSTGKSDLMRFLVVGPVTCASRTLSKSSGILKVVTKRQRSKHLNSPEITPLYIHTQEHCAIYQVISRSCFTRFVRENPTGKGETNFNALEMEDLFAQCKMSLRFFTIKMMAQKKPETDSNEPY